MTPNLTKQKKMGLLAAVVVISLLWLGYQVLLWNSQAQYFGISRKIIESLNIHKMNRDMEWYRFACMLCYLQTLPHVLLAYCLLIKWPGKKTVARVALIAAVFLVSLLTIPRIARNIFPSYKNILSPNNPAYAKVVWIHGIMGMAGVLVVALITLLRYRWTTLLQRRRILRAAGRYGLTISVAVLTAFAYGFVLGILNHYNKNAVNHVLRVFPPDTKLISGMIIMFLMAPLVEEIAFRGLMFNLTTKYSNVWIATIFSSVLFGLWHRNIGQFFPTTVLGMVFAWTYQRTGKLRHAMIVHSISNFTLALALATKESYLPQVAFLARLKYSLLDVSVLGGILGLSVVLILIALILWKGYSLLAEE
ncbi:MAG: CPBP family intramembrane metalloprotease [Oscillospiraceae bacterium]|nr:CPBP family intramembrane metalloprotease [Oscillospiraceae bacterium]